MNRDTTFVSPQRAHPRIAVETFCTAIGDHPDTHAIAVDLSPRGLRIQRPLGGRLPRTLQLELEIPGVDELLWAVGEIRYDLVQNTRSAPARGLAGIIRTCGIHIVTAASYHRKLLREYVIDTYRALERRGAAPMIA